jgi:hypothetical protein
MNRQSLAAALVAMTAGPLAAGALLVALWAALSLAGVTPSDSDQRELLGTLPGGSLGWDWFGGAVFALLVGVDALVRVRCLRALAARTFRPSVAILSVLVAPGLWGWLSDAALGVLLVSAPVMVGLVSFASRPAKRWRPGRRTVAGAVALLALGAAGGWVASGSGLVAGKVIARRGIGPLTWGVRPRAAAVVRVRVTNSGLFPVRLTAVESRTSGALLVPVEAPAHRSIHRDQTVVLSARMRVRPCRRNHAGASQLQAVVVHYTVFGIARQQRLVPEDAPALHCPPRDSG